MTDATQDTWLRLADILEERAALKNDPFFGLAAIHLRRLFNWAQALNAGMAISALEAAEAERDECARICERIEAQKWAAYKGQDGLGHDRGSPRTEGMADGAGLCAQMIRARGADPDLARLTERGAVAWAGVDAQALREGRMPHNAPSSADAKRSAGAKS